MKRYSTLKELSEKLGLSVSTISRALKDHPDISPTTRKRVKDFAALMEYEPNAFATNLRTNKSRMLGIIVPVFNNLFYDSFIAAIEEEARKIGYSVLILQSGESAESELKNLDILKKNRVEGLFVSITCNTKEIAAFHKVDEMGIPVIFFDRVPEFATCNKICFADHDAAALAAQELVRKGRKRILGLFGISTNLSITRRRLEAFQQVFAEQAPATILDIRFNDDMMDARRITAEALRNNPVPDAVFSMGDVTLMGAMMAIHEYNLRVPEDVAVITISHGLIPSLYKPRITYVETSATKMGHLAFARMQELFHGKNFIRENFVEAMLVHGGSL